MAIDNRPSIPFDMIGGILRAVVPPALTYVVAKGWIPQESVGDVLAALSAVGAAIWSVYNKTDSSKIAAVEAIPDVAKIVAVPNPNPDGAVKAAVDDENRTKVTSSTGVLSPNPSVAASRKVTI
jgi:hypothetical protein